MKHRIVTVVLFLCSVFCLQLNSMLREKIKESQLLEKTAHVVKKVVVLKKQLPKEVTIPFTIKETIAETDSSDEASDDELRPPLVSDSESDSDDEGESVYDLILELHNFIARIEEAIKKLCAHENNKNLKADQIADARKQVLDTLNLKEDVFFKARASNAQNRLTWATKQAIAYYLNPEKKSDGHTYKLITFLPLDNLGTLLA